MTSPDIPPQAVADAIDVAVAKIRARVDQEMAEAVAAERERCAQLAEKHWCDCGAGLADLLRQGGEGGGT